MTAEIVFNEPITEWGWKVGVYVALIGIAGGAYLAGYAADVVSYRRGSAGHGAIAKWAYLVGLGGLVIGPPILLSHLATPLRAMLIPLTMTNLGSWMTIGAYMLGGLGIGSTLMFLWLAFGTERPHARAAGRESAVADGGRDVASDGGPARAATGDRTVGGFRGVADRVGLLGAVDSVADVTRPSEKTRLLLGALFGVFAAGVLLYSAMAYGEGSAQRVALWEKTFLVPVQIFSGLGVGLVTALALAAVFDRTPGAVLRTYATAAVGLLGATALALAATVVLLPGQRPAATAGVENLLGTHALAFVGVSVVLGLLVPVALLVAAVLGERRGSLSETAVVSSYVTAAALATVGKVTLAITYLMAAEFAPMPLPV
ncbi:dehydrogenase [Natronorarus salvus]|uniref:dehydrogenase n=1 Tax=Natronorarus salvus TaxID=3117733 RepID=UPI002F265C57